MTTTVAELIAPRSADEITAEQLAALAAEGFEPTAFQPGGVARSMVKADATSLAQLDARVADLAKSNFLDEAEGDWLALRAQSFFDVTPTPAAYTEGYFQLAVASGSGPHSISAAALLVTDGVRRWRSTNTSSVNVTSSAPVNIKVRAESPGDDYNISNGAALTVVSPALAGLSVTNPIYAAGTWITSAGAEKESDPSVRVRARSKWGTTGRGANDSAYLHHARTGHGYEAQTTRATVVWGPGDGTLTVYIAGPAGPVASNIVTAVGAWVDANNPGTDNVTVASAAARVVTLTATIRVASTSDSTENRALATDALAAYFAGLGIGDDVDLGALYHAIYSALGVLDVDIAAPSADVTVSNGEVATLTLDLTRVPV